MYLRRRELLVLVAAALPVARAYGQSSAPPDPDGLLQAFADTILPGRKVEKTQTGAAIHPQAIAGVDEQPGAVEADVLALFHHPKVGFDALAPAFLTDLTARTRGSFLDLDFAGRTEVCKAGLSFDNPARVMWEAAAAVPFTAFCAAALTPEQTDDKAVGYRVMGLPGRSRGYKDFSYGRKFSRERTAKGYLA